MQASNFSSKGSLKSLIKNSRELKNNYWTVKTEFDILFFSKFYTALLIIKTIFYFTIVSLLHFKYYPQIYYFFFVYKLIFI